MMERGSESLDQIVLYGEMDVAAGVGEAVGAAGDGGGSSVIGRAGVLGEDLAQGGELAGRQG